MKEFNREAWLKKAVVVLNEELFDNQLLIDGYQISSGWCNIKKALGEVVTPHPEAEAEYFFTKTIHINVTIVEVEKILCVLAHEMIHCFLGIKGHGKDFGHEAGKIGFEKPYTQYNPSDELIDKCKSIAAKMEKWEGQAIIIPKKIGVSTKKKKGLLFCPTCNYEVRATQKMIKNYGFPTCPCGTKMGEDLSSEESTNEND